MNYQALLHIQKNAHLISMWVKKKDGSVYVILRNGGAKNFPPTILEAHSSVLVGLS